MGDAQNAAESLDEISRAEINLVWKPFWTADRIDPIVRASLGFYDGLPRIRLPDGTDVIPQPFLSPLPAGSALAVPAKAGSRVEEVRAVHPDRAGLHQHVTKSGRDPAVPSRPPAPLPLSDGFFSGCGELTGLRAVGVAGSGGLRGLGGAAIGYRRSGDLSVHAYRFVATASRLECGFSTGGARPVVRSGRRLPQAQPDDTVAGDSDRIKHPFPRAGSSERHPP